MEGANMLARRSVLLGALAVAMSAAALPADADVYVRIGPPPPRVEAIPAPPVGPHRWVWMVGYWRWDGHGYVWARGRYVRREHGAWRAGHWEHRPRDWVWVGGGWH